MAAPPTGAARCPGRQRPRGHAPDIFATERYGDQDWNFPVAAGKSVTVRLYFANQYSGTSRVGQRVFNVLVDGVTKLDHFDIVAAAGDKTGTMRSFTLTTDGNGLDIDLAQHHRERTHQRHRGPRQQRPGRHRLGGRAAQAVGRRVGCAHRQLVERNTAMDWSTVRGAFLVNGTLYYGQPDGRLYSRTFTSSTGAVGGQQTVDLYDDPDTGERIPFAIANLTGMFYDPTNHRIYYTVFGDSRLYYRYFTPESQVVGAQTFTADNNGVDLSAVAGMTLAGGRILYGSSKDGALRSVAFSGGAITGAPSTLSTSGTWKYRAMFVPNS